MTHTHDDRPEKRLHPARMRRAGFTLIELLVSMAVMTVVISGVVAVFVSSMHAVQTGYQSIDAYEMTRGAFSVVERDLSGGFVSRAHGDYYQFFGCPYGMVFVCSSNNNRGAGPSSQPGFTRISYVIRQYYSFNPTGTPTRPARDFVKVKNLNTNREEQVPVYVLVRYVENGVTDLDTFPVDWTGQAYATNPEFPNQAARNLEQELLNTQLLYSDRSPQVQENMVNAKKRELWLRMLRGNGPVPQLQPDGSIAMVPLDPRFHVPEFFYPDPFNYPYNNPPIHPATLRPWENMLDYVVVTNINPPLDTINGDDVNPYRIWGFEYLGDPFAPPVNTALPYPLQNPRPRFWNAEANATYIHSFAFPPGDDRYYTEGGPGSPLTPRLPVVVRVYLPLLFPSPYIGAPDLRRLLDETIDIPSAFTRPRSDLESL